MMKWKVDADRIISVAGTATYQPHFIIAGVTEINIEEGNCDATMTNDGKFVAFFRGVMYSSISLLDKGVSNERPQ